jgi:cysteine dioxygenase
MDATWHERNAVVIRPGWIRNLFASHPPRKRLRNEPTVPKTVSRTMSDDLQAMYRHLNTLTDRPDLARLVKELSRFKIELDDLSEHVHFAENGYKRNLVHSAPNFHVWLLCWKNGQRSPIHNHTGSACVVRVLRGTLTETLFEMAPNGHVKASCSRDITQGSLIGSEDADLHQVSNLQADDADLVTLHVYMPPLTRMNTFSLYDLSRGQEVWYPEFSDAAGI